MAARNELVFLIYFFQLFLGRCCCNCFWTLLLQLLIQLLLTSSWRADETCLLCAKGCIWQHPVDIASFVPTIPKWIVNCVSVSQSQPVMGSSCSHRQVQDLTKKGRLAFMGVSLMIAVILKHALSLNEYVDISNFGVRVPYRYCANKTMDIET